MNADKKNKIILEQHRGPGYSSATQKFEKLFGIFFLISLGFSCFASFSMQYEQFRRIQNEKQHDLADGKLR